MKREIKIGLFLALASIIMAVFILVVGDIGTLIRKPGYEIFLYFDSAAGLEKQTGVRLAGVKIGYVRDVRLKGSQAEVVLSIDPKYQIRTDAKAMLAALGILGEKYIEILPGKSQTYAQPGSTIQSLPPTGLDQVGAELAAVGKEIQETTRMLRELIGTDESKTNIRDILQNIALSQEDGGETFMQWKDEMMATWIAQESGREKTPPPAEETAEADAESSPKKYFGST